MSGLNADDIGGRSFTLPLLLFEEYKANETILHRAKI
jgi:hypothetical protein